MQKDSCILICRCGGKVISDEKLETIVSGLAGFDSDVIEISDLCAFSVYEKERLQTIGEKYLKKYIIACYPRAVQNMLRQGGLDFGAFEVLNYKELSTGEIFSKLGNEYQIAEGEAARQTIETSLEVPAWFPVIDQSRCTLCGKCARFCLFGVYSFDRKSLKVANPLNCKNNCPACGRTCPASAIMFPRLPENTTLSGAEPGEKIASGGKESLFVLLNERNRTRTDIFRQGVILQAEKERQKALEEIQKLTTKK